MKPDGEKNEPGKATTGVELAIISTTNQKYNKHSNLMPKKDIERFINCHP